MRRVSFPCPAGLAAIALVLASSGSQGQVLRPATRPAGRDPVAAHRAAYRTIERELPGYRHVSADRDSLGLEQQSAEGGDVEAYCAGDTIRVLVASYWGESGNLIERFYFSRDSLFFVLRRRERRTPPYRDTPITRVEEERLYFTGPRLVRWLGAGNKPQPGNGAAATKEADSVLADVRELRAAMRGCQPQYAS